MNTGFRVRCADRPYAVRNTLISRNFRQGPHSGPTRVVLNHQSGPMSQILPIRWRPTSSPLQIIKKNGGRCPQKDRWAVSTPRRRSGSDGDFARGYSARSCNQARASGWRSSGSGGSSPGRPTWIASGPTWRGPSTRRGEVPPGRWLIDPAEAFDPRVAAPDRVYSTRGGFVEDFRLDPEGLDLDIDPGRSARLDPMFHLALHAGRQAWHDAAAATEGLDRRRVGVVLGNIVLPTETSSALARATLGRTFAERLGDPGRGIRRDRAAQRVRRGPAGGAGGAGAGAGRRGVHARRGVCVVALRPQARVRRASGGPGRRDADGRAVAARPALHPDGLRAAPRPVGRGSAGAVRRARATAWSSARGRGCSS